MKRSCPGASTLSSAGRTPYGVRGLKPPCPCPCLRRRRRTPYGVRGLKQMGFKTEDALSDVAPRTGCVG